MSADSRFAAYADPAGDVRLYDDRRASWSMIATPPGCSFVSYGSSAILWQCAAGAHVLDLATRRTADVHIDPQFGVTFSRVGAHWIQAGGVGHDPFTFWIDRRTGVYASPQILDSPRVVPDLDKASLYTRLCRPLRRQFVPLSFEEPVLFQPFLYERPYGVQARDNGTLLVGRCGARGGVMLRGATDASLNDRLLTWARGPVVNAYEVTTSRRSLWSFHARVVDVAHTRSRIFVTLDGRRIVAIRRPL